MINTAMAAEMTPSPVSSLTIPTLKARTQTYARSNLSFTQLSFLSSRTCKDVQCLDEGDGNEDHTGKEGGDRHWDPHLLTPTLGHPHQLPLHVLADRASLGRDEPPEVAGLPIEGQHGDEAVEGLDVGQDGPLAQGLDLRQALADAPAHPGQVAGGVAPTPRRQPVEGGPEREAGRQQHGQLLGEHRELEEQTPSPGVRRPGHLLLEDHEGEGRPSEDEQDGQKGGGAHGDAEQAAESEPYAAPPELADPERGHVEGRVDAFETRRQ